MSLPKRLRVTLVIICAKMVQCSRTYLDLYEPVDEHGTHVRIQFLALKDNPVLKRELLVHALSGSNNMKLDFSSNVSPSSLHG